MSKEACRNERLTELVKNLEQIKVYGIKGNVNGREVLAGNVKLLQKYNIAVDDGFQVVDTIVVVAVDRKLADPHFAINSDPQIGQVPLPPLAACSNVINQCKFHSERF